MTGAILPLALLCGAVGLALGASERSSAWLGVAGMAAAACLLAWMPVTATPQPLLYAGLWLSVFATAALIFVPRRIWRIGALAVGANGGAWAGAFAGASMSRSDLFLALPFGLLFLLRQRLEAKGYVIVIKVVTSWMMAIAALAFLVSLMPTPGYVPDHME